eukprot:289588_1
MGPKMINHLSLFYNAEQIETFKSSFKKFLDKYPSTGVGIPCPNIQMVRIAMEGLFPIASNPNWLDDNKFLNGTENTADLLKKNMHWGHVPQQTEESLFIDGNLNYVEQKILPEIVKQNQIHDCEKRSKCKQNNK